MSEIDGISLSELIAVRCLANAFVVMPDVLLFDACGVERVEIIIIALFFSLSLSLSLVEGKKNGKQGFISRRENS